MLKVCIFAFCGLVQVGCLNSVAKTVKMLQGQHGDESLVAAREAVKHTAKDVSKMCKAISNIKLGIWDTFLSPASPSDDDVLLMSEVLTRMFNLGVNFTQIVDGNPNYWMIIKKNVFEVKRKNHPSINYLSIVEGKYFFSSAMEMHSSRQSGVIRHEFSPYKFENGVRGYETFMQDVLTRKNASGEIIWSPEQMSSKNVVSHAFFSWAIAVWQHYQARVTYHKMLLEKDQNKIFDYADVLTGVRAAQGRLEVFQYSHTSNGTTLKTKQNYH